MGCKDTLDETSAERSRFYQIPLRQYFPCVSTFLQVCCFGTGLAILAPCVRLLPKVIQRDRQSEDEEEGKFQRGDEEGMRKSSTAAAIADGRWQPTLRRLRGGTQPVS